MVQFSPTLNHILRLDDRPAMRYGLRKVSVVRVVRFSAGIATILASGGWGPTLTILWPGSVVKIAPILTNFWVGRIATILRILRLVLGGRVTVKILVTGPQNLKPFLAANIETKTLHRWR